MEEVLDSRYGGEWRMVIYVNTAEYAEHIALVKGDPGADGPVAGAHARAQRFSTMSWAGVAASEAIFMVPCRRLLMRVGALSFSFANPVRTA